MCAPALEGTNVLDVYRRVCRIRGENLAERVSAHEVALQRKRSELADNNPMIEVFDRELDMMKVMKTYTSEEVELLMQNISAEPGGSRFLGKTYVYQQKLERQLERQIPHSEEHTTLSRICRLLSAMIAFEECALAHGLKPSPTPTFSVAS